MYCITSGGFATNKHDSSTMNAAIYTKYKCFPGILTSWSVETCVRLTGWPGQNRRGGAAPPEWECWEPSCHRRQRSAAAEGEMAESVGYKHAHTEKQE